MKPLTAVSLLVAVYGLPVSAQPDAGDGIVPIAGGTFVMGTRQADIAALKEFYNVDFPGVFENETPAHEVTLSDFRLDRYEVSNARFGEFVEQNRRWRKEQVGASEHNGNYLADWIDGDYPDNQANLPVAYVTWAAAHSYCRWRGGRLPTEAEWEYVARNGGDREFPWGDELPTADRANYSASGNDERVEVGRYAPNELGVYDLAGNVWEFLLDEWAPNHSPDPSVNPIAGGTIGDEQVARMAGRRSVRGASFGGSVVNMRTRWRDSHVVSNATEFVGFRCAYPPSDEPG